MVDYNLQRLNMVESQVRPSDLTDRRIAKAMLVVERETFLPEALRGVAYSDGVLAIGGANGVGFGREVLSPNTVAQMIQSLNLDAQDVVLLVGAGTGYEAAVLAEIVQTVVALEVDQVLAEHAETCLEAAGVGNVAVVCGPLAEGVAGEGPFDAILINGAVDTVEAQLLDQLKDGGRMAALKRQGDVARLARWRRIGESFAASEHQAAAGRVLPGMARATAFVF